MKGLQLKLFLSVLSILLGTSSIANAQSAVGREQDGIIAAALFQNDSVRLAWRFAKSLKEPLREIKASFRGVPLATPVIEDFPAAGQRTAIIAMLDMGGTDREVEIDRLKATLLVFAARKRLHNDIAIGVYGNEGFLLVPPADQSRSVVEMLLDLRPLGQPSNLAGVLLHAMGNLSNADADRRAIFVFSDGHNDSPATIPLEGIADLARAAGIALNFVLVNGQRSANLEQLAKVAESTGGELIAEADHLTFLEKPFDLLDSGGRAVFSFPPTVRYFWEKPAAIDISFEYGEKKLQLQLASDQKAASAQETLKTIVQDYPLAALGASSVLGCGLALLLVARRNRTDRKGSAKRPGSDAPPDGRAEQGAGANRHPFELQDIENGHAYPLDRRLTKIGRASSNDIVIDDDTVSRNHAVLLIDDEGKLAIESLSEINPTQVNHIAVQSSPLVSGDLIGLGATTLRVSTRATAAKPVAV